MKFVSIKLVAGLAVAAFYLGLSPQVQAQRLEVETRLTNTGIDPLASGHARYREEPGRRDFRTQVEDVRTTTLLIVFAINPDFTAFEVMGALFVDPVTRRGELEINTQDGDQVPRLGDGWWIVVFDLFEPNPLLFFGQLRPRQ